MSKLNLVKPNGTIIALGEVEYNLVYDFNAFSELERAFGDIQTAFDRLSKAPKFSEILTILAAGLVSNVNPPSKELLGSYITPNNVGQVVELIGESLAIAMPKTDEAKSGKN